MRKNEIEESLIGKKKNLSGSMMNSRGGISPAVAAPSGPFDTYQTTTRFKIVNGSSQSVNKRGAPKDPSDVSDLTDSGESAISGFQSCSEFVAPMSSETLFEQLKKRQDEQFRVNLDAMQQKMEALIHAKMQSDDERSKLADVNANLRKKINTLQSELHQAKTDLSLAQEKVDRFPVAFATSKKKIDDLHVANVDLRAKIAHAEMRHGETSRKQESEIANLKIELSVAKRALEEDLTPMKAEHEILKKKYTDLHRAHREFQEEHDKILGLEPEKKKKHAVEYAGKLLYADETKRTAVQEAAIAVCRKKEEPALLKKIKEQLMDEYRVSLEQDALKLLLEKHPHVAPLIDDQLVALTRNDLATKARCEKRITAAMVEDRAVELMKAEVARQKEAYLLEQGLKDAADRARELARISDENRKRERYNKLRNLYEEAQRDIDDLRDKLDKKRLRERSRPSEGESKSKRHRDDSE